MDEDWQGGGYIDELRTDNRKLWTALRDLLQAVYRAEATLDIEPPMRERLLATMAAAQDALDY